MGAIIQIIGKKNFLFQKLVQLEKQNKLFFQHTRSK